MSVPTSLLRQPSYRRHKASGQAVVTIGGFDHYLGRFNSKESKLAYQRLMLEWLSNDGQMPPPKGESITVVEIANAYRRYAKRFYVRDGAPTATYDKIAMLMKSLGTGPYGKTAARDFGPLALKAIQHQLATDGKSRTYVNDLVDIIRRCFKWAVSEELVPPSIYQALQTVNGLRRGRSPARETAPVQPVDDATVEATLPHLPPVVDDMVRLLRLLGCRPGELCVMRPLDIDRSRDVWTYKPRQHKSERFGKTRTVYIGPKAQAILTPYLLRAAEDYCFSPAESDAKRRATLHANRKTPLSCGNKPGSNRKRGCERRFQSHYNRNSLLRAINRACDKADAAARAAVQAEAAATQQPAADVRLIPHWFTYQLRHSAGTEVRRSFGLEAAQVILGHSKADVTQIYAERDERKAEEIMLQVG